MPADIVIDTNILLHACDPRQSSRADCVGLIEGVIKSELHICLDEGYHYCESRNRSKIMSEYFKFVLPGSLGYALLTELGQQQRIRTVSKKVCQNTRTIIQRCVSDPTDRCFVKVTANSEARVMVSHDWEAMNEESRRRLKTEVDINIFDARTARKTIT